MRRRCLPVNLEEDRTMNLQQNSLGLVVLIICLAAIDPAVAQEKKSAVRIEGCTPLLQLAEVQYASIRDEFEQLKKVKAERGTVVDQLRQAENATPNQQQPAGPETQLAKKPVVVAPELTKLYDIQIGKIEASVESKRKLVTAIETVYRECIKTPPGARAAAQPSQSKLKR